VALYRIVEPHAGRHIVVGSAAAYKFDMLSVAAQLEAVR